MEPVEVSLRRVRMAHLRWRLAAIDEARAVMAAIESGVDMAELAATAGVRSNPGFLWLAKDLVRFEVPAGFSGASVREMGERYAVGELSQDQLCAELARWRAAPGADLQEHDRDVGMLLVDELIDLVVYRRLRRAIG